jgi:hypothetical protein
MRIAILGAALAALVPAHAGAAIMITGNESFFIADTGAELLPVDALVGPNETRSLDAVATIGSAKFTTTLGPLNAVGQGVNGRYGGDYLSLTNLGSSLTIDFAPGTFAFGFRLGRSQPVTSTQLCINTSTCFFLNPPTSGFQYFGIKETAGLSRVSFNLSGSQAFDLAALRVARNAVPEPGTWAMLIAGFGLVGASLRRRRHAVKSCATA